MEIPKIVGAGLVIIGTGIGIGLIGRGAMDAIGRQPYGKVNKRIFFWSFFLADYNICHTNFLIKKICLETYIGYC